MNQTERQRIFLEGVRLLKKSALFADTMSRETVTRATALTLFQLTQEAHGHSLKLLNTLGGDTTPRIE